MKLKYLSVIVSVHVLGLFAANDLSIDQQKLSSEGSMVVDAFLDQHHIDRTDFDMTSYQFTGTLGDRADIKPDCLKTFQKCGLSWEQVHDLLYCGAVLRLAMSSKDVFNMECRPNNNGEVYGRCWVTPAGGYNFSKFRNDWGW